MTEDELEEFLIRNEYFGKKEQTNDNNEKRSGMGSPKNL